MAWRITGQMLRPTIEAWFAWDGDLTGSPEAVALCKEQIEKAGSARVTPTGPFLEPDTTNELAAFVLARNTMRYYTATGDVPDLGLEELPEGSVA